MRLERTRELLRETAAQLANDAPTTPIGDANRLGAVPGREHHLFLAASALHAAGTAEDLAKITPLLLRLMAEQREHVHRLGLVSKRQLDDLDNDPHDQHSGLCRKYDLHLWPAPDRDRQRRGVIHRLNARIAEVERALMSRKPETAFRTLDQHHMWDTATRQASTELYERMLHAGGHERLLQALITIETPGEQPQPERCPNLTRIVRAYRILGWGRRWHAALVGDELMRKHAKTVVAFSASSLRSDDDDATMRAHPRMFSVPPRTKLATTREDALAYAHGLLRSLPSGYADAPAGLPIRANVAVTGEALHEIASSFRSSDIWAGVEPFTCEGTSPQGRVRPLLEELPGGGIHIGAAATVRARIGARIVEVRFLAALASLPANEALNTGRIREIVSRRLNDPTMQSSDIPVDMWDGDDVDTPAPNRRHCAPARTGRVPFLGRTECRHDDATWHTTRAADFTAPYLRLRCGRCLRGQVATAPLHRMPGGQLSAPDDIDRYVRARRAEAAFNGERLPDDLTLHQLIARDGPVDLDPTRYADERSQAHTAVDRRRGRLRPMRDLR